MQINGLMRVFARACTLAALCFIMFIAFFYGLVWLGCSETIAAIGAAILVLAPGCYDYLGRDLLGQKILHDELDDHDNCFQIYANGQHIIRHADCLLNQADFIFIAQNLDLVLQDHKDRLQTMTYETWSRLPPSDELVIAANDTLDRLIQDAFDMAEQSENVISLYMMFLIDLSERLEHTQMPRESTETSVANRAVH